MNTTIFIPEVPLPPPTRSLVVRNRSSAADVCEDSSFYERRLELYGNARHSHRASKLPDRIRGTERSVGKPKRSRYWPRDYERTTDTVSSEQLVARKFSHWVVAGQGEERREEPEVEGEKVYHVQA